MCMIAADQVIMIYFGMTSFHGDSFLFLTRSFQSGNGVLECGAVKGRKVRDLGWGASLHKLSSCSLQSVTARV